MAVNGSIWVEGGELHFITGDNNEYYYTYDYQSSAPSEAVSGSIWVDGSLLHYITENGYIHSINDYAHTAVSGAVAGSIWIENEIIYIIDSGGDKVQLGSQNSGPFYEGGTSISAPQNLSGSGSVDGSGDYSLNWDAPSSIGSGIDYYIVYDDGVQEGTTTSTSWNGNQGLTTSSYTVTAVDTSGDESPESNSVLIKTTDGLSCFVEGTLITVEGGEQRPIEELVVGDRLVASDIQGFSDTNNVDELYSWNGDSIKKKDVITTIKEITEETMPSTVIINEGQLEASNPHSQLIKRDNIWKFIPLENLQVGDILINHNNEEIEVQSLKIKEDPATVYKMTLEEPYHTFYANGILTHNVKLN